MKNTAEKLYTIRNGQLVEVTPEPPAPKPEQKPAESKKLLNIHEVMKELGLGRSKVVQLLTAGEIRSIRIGRVWRIPFWAIDEFVNKAR